MLHSYLHCSKVTREKINYPFHWTSTVEAVSLNCIKFNVLIAIQVPERKKIVLTVFFIIALVTFCRFNKNFVSFHVLLDFHFFVGSRRWLLPYSSYPSNPSTLFCRLHGLQVPWSISYPFLSLDKAIRVKRTRFSWCVQVENPPQRVSQPLAVREHVCLPLPGVSNITNVYERNVA
jgi:hypothetical protein